MLTEFAITPSVFDEEAQPNGDLWRQQLDRLLWNMFPSVSAWPVMVSDLHGGSWQKTVLQMISSIKDHRAKRRCQDLLQNATKTLVVRPSHCDWPSDERAWAEEALQSNSLESIDRILMTPEGRDTLGKGSKIIRGLDEVEDAGFWQGVSADASPRMKIQVQVKILRKICVHSEFLCLITPYIHGGSDDETDFAIALIRSAFDRPPGWSSVDIEIHTQAGNDAGESVGPCKSESSVIGSLGAVLKPGQQLQVFFWPKLLERLLVAGVCTTIAPGQRRRSPRWGVSMNHLARKQDENNGNSRTEWKLLKRDSLGHWFSNYCQEGAASHVRMFTVQG